MRADRAWRAAEWLGRRGDRVVFVLGAIMLAAYLAAMVALPKATGRVVFGDATHHFVQLRSMIFDRDLDLMNEYIRIYDWQGDDARPDRILAEFGTSTGRMRNYMPIGPALLWAPAYLLVIAVQWLLGIGGSAPDGFGRAAQIAPGVTGVCAAAAGAWLSWRTARRFTDQTSAILGTIAVWLGTHALYYSMVSPSYSHAASMLTSAAFVAYWFRGTAEPPSFRRMAILGALAGAATLMRWQDVVLLLVPGLEVLSWRAGWGARVAGVAVAVLAWLVIFSPQMLVWQALYGQAFAIPQGPSFMQWTSPHPIDVLFSTNHGLLTWAPLLVISIVGLVAFVRRQPALRPGVVAVLLASWYINGAVADWWAGEAFGARRFLSLFPLFVVGTAVWFQAAGASSGRRLARMATAAGLIVLNGLLLLQYQLFMKGLTEIAPYPSGWLDMWVARFVVPVRLLEWWLR